MSSQIVVVTGAASGIGAAIALCFAKLNAGLCLTDINEQDLLKTRIECQKLSKTKVVEIVADMRKAEDVENIVEFALKEFRRIDVLVNSAGIYEATSLHNSDIIDKFDRIITTNLRSVVDITNKALPALIKSKGCIINLSSVCSTLIIKNNVVYAMAKAALATFTKHAAFELANDGVRVNCISPSTVKTNIFKHAGYTDNELEKALTDVIIKTPLKKMVTVEDIAELAVYLASDKAASITGSDIFVDGGVLLGTVENAL